MTSLRKLAIVLAVSVGLNLFLIGAAITHFIHHKDRTANRMQRHTWMARSAPERPEAQHGRPNGSSRKRPFGQRPRQGSKADPQDHSPHPSPLAKRRWAKRRGHHRPPHAPLLRKLVRAAGGPRDPHVQKLLARSRTTMKETRRQIGLAQTSVEEALLATPYDEAAVKSALDELSRQTQVAQAHAQGLLLQLASQLTEQERKELQESAATPER